MKDKTTFLKIKKVLSWSISSPLSSFYRDLYKTLPQKDLLHLTPELFKTLPFLTRDMIAQTKPSDRTFFPPHLLTLTKISSGTTNTPLIIFSEGLDSSVQNISWKILQENKVQRMFYLLTGYQMYVRWHVYKTKTKKNNIWITTGETNNLGLSARIAKETQIDAIETTPTLLSLFIPYLQTLYPLKHIRYISLSSEYTSSLQLAYFKSCFPKAVFNFYCGSAETNPFGYRCKFLTKNKPPYFFHFFPNVFPEVIDEMGQTTGKEIPGELVLTSLQKTAFPLLRYRTGNKVVLRNKRCTCKETLTFELLGRIQTDFIKVHGTIIHPMLIENALMQIQHVVEPDYQLHIFEKKRKGGIMPLLVIQLVKKSGVNISETTIKQTISDNLYLSTTQNLSDLVKKGVYLPLQIEWVEQIEKKSKAKTLISHIK